MNRTIAAGLILLAAPGAAAAQDAAPAGWAFAGTLYGWLPAVSSSVETALGTVDGDVSASDAISDLDFAFMGAFEARRGRWSMIGDLIYADISSSEPAPRGVLFNKATLDTTLTAFSGYAAYRVHEDPKVALDVAAGFRLFDADLDVRFSGNLAESRSFGNGDTWTVPLIAARAVVQLAPKWYATAFADLGATGSDDLTWQALATVGYRFADDWSAILAYRYMDIEKSIGGRDASIELYGPAIGVTYRF